MKTLTASLLFLFGALSLSACGGSKFTVKSDPLQADVSVIDPTTNEKKPLGKTPLEIPMAQVGEVMGNSGTPGEFFKVVVERPGFVTQEFSVPRTRFGTTLTLLDVKLKEGDNVKEKRVAKDILDHLYLAQKFALSQQFERAQIELDRILADFPDFPRALSMRASIYFAQKNFTESQKWYEAALKADPQMEDAMKMVAKVRSLTGDTSTRLPAASTSTPVTGATVGTPPGAAPAAVNATAPAPATPPAAGGR